MKAFLACLVLLLPLIGCGSTDSFHQTTATWESGSTDLSLQRGINILADKHDEYVTADPSLTSERATYLAESTAVRTAFMLADVKTAAVRAPLNSMLARLEAYVKGDTLLSPADADEWVLDIKIVRRTVAESR